MVKIILRSFLSVLFMFGFVVELRSETSMESFGYLSNNWLSDSCSDPDWCNSMDSNKDGVVDNDDLLNIINEWLFNDARGIVWIAIDKPGFSGEISKYETTNLQYANYLNQALSLGLVFVHSNGYVYCTDDIDCSMPLIATYSTINQFGQIIYSNGEFIVRERDCYDMSNHPVSWVSWYGAKAFCDYYGYHLPSEPQWTAVADYEDNHYACGCIIDISLANYNVSNPLSLTSEPYTTPVGFYPAYGYDINDMAGNVWEWTSSSNSVGSYVVKGGAWDSGYYYCTVDGSKSITASNVSGALGFRVCR
ncbi:MAG: formylglycine-generating enzyme family protein [Sedimentisphaeraceae bacterium JB056]